MKDLLEAIDYKDFLRIRMDAINRDYQKLTFRKMADHLKIQYTYLSRVMNSDSTHLTEDHLFEVATLLDLDDEETEYLVHLREREVSQSLRRKKQAEQKLAEVRKAKELRATLQEVRGIQLNREMAYLFDPFAVVVHLALHVEKLQNALPRIAAGLGIEMERLFLILDRLQELNFIEWDRQTKVVQLKEFAHFHYGPDHPLMRMHQFALRQLCGSQLLKLSEGDKKTSMVTFAADQATVDEIKRLFSKFLSEVEQVAFRADGKTTHAYQMNFELFRWI